MEHVVTSNPLNASVHDWTILLHHPSTLRKITLFIIKKWPTRLAGFHVHLEYWVVHVSRGTSIGRAVCSTHSGPSSSTALQRLSQTMTSIGGKLSSGISHVRGGTSRIKIVFTKLRHCSSAVVALFDRRGSNFKGNGIPRNSGKMVVPYPSRRFLTALDTDGLLRTRHSLLLVCVGGAQILCVPSPYN